MSLSAGQRLGPYEIVSPLGSGGMGEVWRARDTRLERAVAVKVLPEAFAKDEQFRQRPRGDLERAVAAENGPLAHHYVIHGADLFLTMVAVDHGISVTFLVGIRPMMRDISSWNVGATPTGAGDTT